MRARPTTLTMVGLLAVSLGTNLFLGRQVLHLWRTRAILALDPAPATAFAAENRALGPPVPGRVRVVYFGDSRIRDWVPLPPLAAAESINRGRRGDTTAMALRRLQQDVLDLRPRVVVLHLGINDLKAVGLLPGRAGEIVDAACRRVAALVAALRERSISVVILTVWPRGPIDLSQLPHAHPAVDRAIGSFNAYLGSLAGDGVRVLDCAPALARRGRVESRHALDMLHLNAAGYDRLGACLAPHLEALIEAPAARSPV